MGRLDIVLRALWALRPGDPRNDVVIGREDDRNVKKIVKKSKNCVEKYIKVVENNNNNTNLKISLDKSEFFPGKSENFPDKSEKFPGQI